MEKVQKRGFIKREILLQVKQFHLFRILVYSFILHGSLDKRSQGFGYRREIE
jgi:hypothetical protein